MGSRFASLLLKEFIQFFRDRVVLILILFLYLVDSVMCTVALSYDVKDVSMAIVDSDQTALSRDLTHRFLAAKEFHSAGSARSEGEATAWLRAGRVIVVLIIPKGFADAVAAHPPGKLQVLLDGTNSNTALIARGYVAGVVQIFERDLAVGHNIKMAAMTLPIVRVWFNPNLTFTSFMVLGMIATAAMMMGVIQPAASIVREKEVGTIEQLMITPIRTGELFAAKTLPTLAMGILALFPSLLVINWFDVPLRGSLLLFLALTAIFLLSAISLGVLIASVSRTLQQALLLAFFALFPILFLSGTLVPVESMPQILQTASLISPLRHYEDVILGIFLKGSGIADLWPQTLALLGLGTLLYGLAYLRFARS